MMKYWTEISQAVFGGPRAAPEVTGPGIGGADTWPARHAVTDFACATIGAAGQALAEVSGAGPVWIDRRLASLWFHTSAAPRGWQIPDIWDAVAGNYAARDGWIRLHTNAPHHRAAAIAALGCDDTRDAVGAAVATWRACDLETAVVAAGGAAAALRSTADWSAHPQGRAVAAEPLVIWSDAAAVAPRPVPAGPRPLDGVRVLDLTRVLAGPVATRFLAGCGAQVLRIDPPWWDEPAVLPDVMPGKRSAGLDLRRTDDRATLRALLARADVLVHGYRPGALDALGFGPDARRAANPALIDVSLSAYGHSGPWAGRRGFDSLVQMSSGIAAPREAGGAPHPLPVQALDHATGYLMAAAVLRALALRTRGRVVSARLSLARTGVLLTAVPGSWDGAPLVAQARDRAPGIEDTDWGPLLRLVAPVRVGPVPLTWDRPAGPLRRDAAAWR